MTGNEHVDRLASIWKDSPTTRADVEDRYPGLAWAIENVLTHGWTSSVQLMSRDTSELYSEMIRRKPKQRDVSDDVTTDVVRAGDLVLRFARVDRLTRHPVPDGQYESDTDHTVMLGVIGCAFAAEHLPRLSLGKIAQLALAHDLVEAYAGDVHTLRELSPAEKARKERDEWLGWTFIKRSITSLPWIADTIADYDRRSTAEQIYVWAMDKNMPKITHLLDGGAVIRESGMGRDELADRFESQRLELSKQIDLSPIDLSPVLDLHVALAEHSLRLYDDFADDGDDEGQR